LVDAKIIAPYTGSEKVCFLPSVDCDRVETRAYPISFVTTLQIGTAIQPQGFDT
jgi:hypothetical protein